MKRILVVLVAGTVLVGAGAPVATATTTEDDQPAKVGTILAGDAEATAQDWAEFFEVVGDLNATFADFEASTLSHVQDWRWDQCKFQSLNDPLWTAREERLTVKCAVRRWSVPGGLSQMLGVGECESGMNRFADNHGNYLGLFQHAASAWMGRVRSAPARWHLSERWTNSRSQAVVTARMAHADGDWGQWAGCA